jgi:hypothetical protein
VDLGGQRVRVLVPAERVVPRGAPVVLAVDPARLRLLPAVEG